MFKVMTIQEKDRLIPRGEFKDYKAALKSAKQIFEAEGGYVEIRKGEKEIFDSVTMDWPA